MQRADWKALRKQLLRDWKVTDNRIFRMIVLFALALMAAVSLYAGAKNAFYYSQDFQWDAAKALVLGADPYELSLNPEEAEAYPELVQFYRLFTDKGLKQKMEANQFPSLLMLLAPYTFLSPFAARIAWLFSNLVFTAGIAVLLKRTLLKELSGFEFAVAMLLMIAGTPYRNQLGVGQHTLFSFFFFLLAVYFDGKECKGQRIFLTLSLFVCFFKYTLTAPLALYFVYKKRYRELVVSILMHGVLTVAASFILGKSVIYLLVQPLRVAMNLSSEGGLDIGALTGGGVVSLAIGGVVGILLFILSLKMPEGRDYILLPLLILWSLIITYHRTYDFFVISAVSMLFTDGFFDSVGEKAYRCWLISYGILLAAVYFGLRVFNENTFSRIGVGMIYYAFTLALSYHAVKSLRQIKTEGKPL